MRLRVRVMKVRVRVRAGKKDLGKSLKVRVTVDRESKHGKHLCAGLGLGLAERICATAMKS